VSEHPCVKFNSYPEMVFLLEQHYHTGISSALLSREAQGAHRAIGLFLSVP